MRVELTGNKDATLKKITWDDLPPCDKHGKNLKCATFRGRYQDMKHQNACIDLTKTENTESILEIWTGLNQWSVGFIPIRFCPNSEIYNQPKSIQDLPEWEHKNIAILEIVPENKADILAMNHCLYGILREKAYDESVGEIVIHSGLQSWAKGLKNDILKGYNNTPIGQNEYIQTVVKNIWKEVEKHGIHNDITFSFLIEEELERLKLGKVLISETELIENQYRYLKISKDEGYKEFPHLFMYRIIAHDIAKIILDLETGKFFPETPETEAPAKKSKSTTDISFKWLSNPESELPPLFHNMKNAGLIASETTLEQFTAIFSGQPIQTIAPVNWLKEQTLLAYFLEKIREKQFINKYIDLWMIGSNCFTVKGKIVTNKRLSDLQYQYSGNKSGKPKNHKIIDDLFS